MTKENPTSEGSVRSVERALSLLDTLARSDRSLTLTELSKRTGMSKATVLRLMAALEKWSFVEKIHSGYQLNVAILPLAYAFLMNNSLTRAALPVLQGLAIATRATATLYVRSGLERIVVQRVEGSDPLRHALPVGQRLPLLVGAPGVVLAAYMPGADLHALLELHPETRLATGEQLNQDQHLQRLERARQQGYVVSRSERLNHIFAAAAPVIGADGLARAAVSVTGYTHRLTPELEPQIVEDVQRASRAIAESAGAWALTEQPDRDTLPARRIPTKVRPTRSQP